MKTALALLVCLLSWQFSGVVCATANSENVSTQASELLERAEEQNATDHVLAVETAKQALALFKSANDVTGMAKTYYLLGECYYAQTLMTDAAQYYELSIEMWRKQSNPEKQVPSLWMLGYIEGRRGELLNGISYLMQAHNLTRDSSQLGAIAAGMAYFFNESGLPEHGLKQYQRAMEYYRQAGDTRFYYRDMMLVGYTHFLLQDYAAALTELQEAVAHFETSDHPKAPLDAAECHDYLGRIYFAKGQYGLALQHWQPVPLLYEKTGNEGDIPQVQALIGQVYERMGAIDRARATYLEASQTFRKIDDRVNDAAVRFALGRLELGRNNFDAAESYLKESIETTETIRRDLKSRMLASAFSASVHDRYEAYIQCLMRKRKKQTAPGLEVQAFEASELARARSLSELLSDTQTKVLTAADPKLIEQERTLRQAIRAKVEQTIKLLAGDYQKEQLDALETSLTGLREQHKQVVEQLQKQNPHYDQITEPTTYSLRQVQEQIVEDDQTILLEYFVGTNASYLWAVTRNDVRVFDLPGADEITVAVRVVYDRLSKAPKSETDSELDEATAKLSKMVLGPVANQLTGKRIIVVADGALNYIPFQSLAIGAGNQPPLIANYEIVNAPSASILGQLRQEKQRRQPGTKILVAFGDPKFPSNYAGTLAKSEFAQQASRSIDVEDDKLDPATIQPLLYSKAELDNLSEIAGEKSFIAREFEASREVLEKVDFSKYSILHFATHGLLNQKKPENSGFYLSLVSPDGRPQNGFITMQDVYDLKTPVDLAVLSACQTALGKDVRGEGLIGLTRGFMHAGASSVVASLWKVDDEATAELMKYFYTNMLKDGMRPAEALRAAQNTLRQKPEWRSPHFWAAFTLQGEFKEPLKLPAPTGASRTVPYAVGAGFVVLLLAGIAWGYWRRRSAVYSTSK